MVKLKPRFTDDEMVKLFKSSGIAITTMLSTADKVIIVEVWNVDKVVEEVVVATAPEALMVSVVETVEVKIFGRSRTDAQCHHRYAQLRNGRLSRRRFTFWSLV